MQLIFLAEEGGGGNLSNFLSCCFSFFGFHTVKHIW